MTPDARLRWWTRVPSARSLAVLAVVVAAAAGCWAVSPVAAALGTVAGLSVTSSRWWWGETAWRRAHPQLDDHAVVARVAAVSAVFGLWRTPTVLLVADMDSPAAAIDTAHPGSTVLVSPQMLRWATDGSVGLVDAILAHELGHLHRLHTAVQLLQRTAWLATLGSLLAAAAGQAAAGRFAAARGLRVDVSPATLLVAAGAAAVLGGLLEVVQNHLCELDADRDAARLGHARELAAVLDQPRRRLSRGVLTHPHPARRVAALRR